MENSPTNAARKSPSESPSQPDSYFVSLLLRSIDSWASRRYAQGADWTETNESRRARQLEFLNSLLNGWKKYHRFSPKQRELIKRLARNAGVKLSHPKNQDVKSPKVNTSSSRVATKGDSMTEKKRDDEKDGKSDKNNDLTTTKNSKGEDRSNEDLPEGDFEIGVEMDPKKEIEIINALHKKGEARDEDRARAGSLMLEMIMQSGAWPTQIEDRDFEFLKSLIDREEAGTLTRLSPKQWLWLYDAWDEYVKGNKRREKY